MEVRLLDPDQRSETECVDFLVLSLAHAQMLTHYLWGIL
jgi:hypothetical protein